MEVSRIEERQPGRRPAEWFTGTTTITPLFDPKARSAVGAALVRFDPGARTAWHKHPLGQRLVILEGRAWTPLDPELKSLPAAEANLFAPAFGLRT